MALVGDEMGQKARAMYLPATKIIKETTGWLDACVSQEDWWELLIRPM